MKIEHLAREEEQEQEETGLFSEEIDGSVEEEWYLEVEVSWPEVGKRNILILRFGSEKRCYATIRSKCIRGEDNCQLVPGTDSGETALIYNQNEYQQCNNHHQ